MDITEYESTGKYSFNFQEIVKVPEDHKNSIKRGLALTWDKWSGQPRSFSIIIANFFHHPETGQRLDTSSEYDPDRDTFSFALDEMRKRIKLNLSEDFTLFILAAHEAYHAIQCFQGRRPPPSINNPDYENDVYEEEAWNAAIQIFKEEYPGSKGSIRVSNKTFKF